MDIHFLIRITLDVAKSLLKEYINNEDIKILITEEEIGDKDFIIDNIMWCQLIQRDYGDVKSSLEIFCHESFLGSYLKFGYWLANNKNLETISEYEKNQNYAEWSFIDKRGKLKTLIEDVGYQFPEGEDGIKIKEILP